ncbi:MAG: hypothetical protein E7559_00195 [Ruminococcaceae bacterium]|nr:hypothetical protein [Oscillospiraceae bacterium]
MAERSVFLIKNCYPFYEEVIVPFPWFGGFALAQKQRNALSLKMNLEAACPQYNVCEISSGSLDPVGRSLSAMSLSKRMSDGTVVVMESAFQSSRIYCVPQTGEVIGPFPELLGLDGRACKKTVKEASCGLHSCEYMFDGMSFPTPDFHPSLFYDYLYINALMEPENAEVAENLRRSGYNAFSDLATKSLNTQARSCAIYLSLCENGLLEQAADYDSFMKLFRVDLTAPNYAATGAYEDVPMSDAQSGCRRRVSARFSECEVKQRYDELRRVLV